MPVPAVRGEGCACSWSSEAAVLLACVCAQPQPALGSWGQLEGSGSEGSVSCGGFNLRACCPDLFP